MFFKFALFATLACHSLALPNHIKRQEAVVSRQWTDIKTFLSDNRNPATNDNYACTDRCGIWDEFNAVAKTPSIQVFGNFCPSRWYWEMQMCTGCLIDYFMPHPAQPNPIGNLLLIQEFMIDHENCLLFTTDAPEPTTSSSTDDQDPSSTPDSNQDPSSTPDSDQDPSSTPDSVSETSTTSPEPPASPSMPSSSTEDPTISSISSTSLEAATPSSATGTSTITDPVTIITSTGTTFISSPT